MDLRTFPPGMEIAFEPYAVATNFEPYALATNEFGPPQIADGCVWSEPKPSYASAGNRGTGNRHP
jgi:hypothetical protein